MSTKKALESHDRIVLRSIALTVGMDRMKSLRASVEELVDFILKEGTKVTEAQIDKLRELPQVDFDAIEEAFQKPQKKVLPLKSKAKKAKKSVPEPGTAEETKEEVLKTTTVVASSPTPDLEQMAIKLAHIGESVSKGFESNGTNLKEFFAGLDGLDASLKEVISQQKIMANALAYLLSSIAEPCTDISELPDMKGDDTGPTAQE